MPYTAVLQVAGQEVYPGRCTRGGYIPGTPDSQYLGLPTSVLIVLGLGQTSSSD